jgi:hypothetical protein
MRFLQSALIPVAVRSVSDAPLINKTNRAAASRSSLRLMPCHRLEAQTAMLNQLHGCITQSLSSGADRIPGALESSSEISGEGQKS